MPKTGNVKVFNRTYRFDIMIVYEMQNELKVNLLKYGKILMRIKIFFLLLFSFFLLVISSYGAMKESKGTPSAVIVSSKYEFPPVFEGVRVVHDFIIQNKGSAVLEIKSVKPV